MTAIADGVSLAVNRKSLSQSYPGHPPFAELLVGDEPSSAGSLDPHRVRVLNEWWDPRSFVLTLYRGDNREFLLQLQATFVARKEGPQSPRPNFMMLLREPARYTIEMAASDGLAAVTHTISQEGFDAGATYVRLQRQTIDAAIRGYT